MPDLNTKMLYMDDIDGNYLKEFEAEIVKIKDDYVVLDQTAFYPLGGGQPSDTGHLEKDGKQYRIKEVTKKGIVKHHLEDLEGLQVGDRVMCTLDWETRHAHMRMHTAQHLISALVYDTYKARTVGNQIYADKSRIDFEPLTKADTDLELIENLMNEYVEKELPVTVTEEQRDNLEQCVDPAKVNLDLLPASIKVLRVIKVGDIDICPCAGTHIRNTKEIGRVKILKKDNKGSGRVRITYELH
jgi:misacylated tRNA(Ala) deacylase